jgi:tetratricopeptide (TPR) repeat protein
MKSFSFSRSIYLMVLLILIPCAFAQQGTQGSGAGSSGTGSTNSGNSGTGSTGSGNSGSITPTPRPSVPTIPTPSTGNRTPQIPVLPELIYISGAVMQEDGSPPPFGTVIELDCGNTVTREAIVDSDGHYGFQVGSGHRIGRVMADAGDRIEQDVFDLTANAQDPVAAGLSTTMQSTPLSVQLLRCELRAQYPGYRSTSTRMRPGSIWGYTEVGTILVYQISRVQGTSVSMTSMLAPKGARRAVEQASKLLKKEKFDEAETLLKSAIAAYPKNAEAWYLLGETYHFRNRANDARDSYARALQADRMYVRPYLRLARLSMTVEDWKGAAELSGKSLELDPIAFPEAYYLHALANFNMQDLATAERSARKGQRLDLDRQYPQMHLILANILLMKQDAKGAMEEMRGYLRDAPKAADAPLVRARLEEKEKLAKVEIK